MATTDDAVPELGRDQSEGAKLERLITSLGQFGRYQQYVFLLTCIGSFVSAMAVVAMPFLAFDPPNRCQVSPCEPVLNETQYLRPFLNFTTPYNDEKERWSQCQLYNLTGGRDLSSEELDDVSCSSDQFTNNSRRPCDAGHVYDDSLFRNSIITDFDLYCVSSFYRSLSGVGYMIGMLVGAITLGDLSDRLGRRNGLLVSAAIPGLCGIVSAVAPNYPVFLVARLLTGFGAVGLFQMAFVLAVEFIGIKYRTFVGIMIETPFALGEAMTGVLAYFIRDWRYLQLAVTVPALFLLSFHWLMPESIRWLVSQGRTDEAISILKSVAKTNKKELPDERLNFIRERNNKSTTPVLGPTKNSRVDLVSCDHAERSPILKEPKKTVIDLLRTPNMRRRSVNMFFCWSVVTFMYYGLSLNSGSMGSNIFVSFILTMLIEIPSYFFCWYALDRMGRKGTLMFAIWLAGISCIIAGLLGNEYTTATMVLSLVGKFGASAAFAIVYVFSSEIFPTDYRGVGIGACSMFARVGGMLAPLIVEVFRGYPSVAPVIFGVLGCMCGLTVTFLPETVGCRLPQTLEESERFGSGVASCPSFGCGDEGMERSRED